MKPFVTVIVLAVILCTSGTQAMNVAAIETKLGFNEAQKVLVVKQHRHHDPDVGTWRYLGYDRIYRGGTKIRIVRSVERDDSARNSDLPDELRWELRYRVYESPKKSTDLSRRQDISHAQGESLFEDSEAIFKQQNKECCGVQ